MKEAIQWLMLAQEQPGFVPSPMQDGIDILGYSWMDDARVAV